jgi:ATP-dependent metalloprotease FtsH
MAFWALVVLLSLVAYRMYQGSFMTPQRADISYTRFVQEVDRGNVKNMQVMGKAVTGEFKSDASLNVNGNNLSVRHFKTSILGDGTDIRDRVWAADPNVEIEVHEEGINWLSVLFTWLPLIVVFGVWLFLIRQMQSGGSAALKFGKTKAKVLIESSPKVTFKDVAGCDEAKQELQEVIDFLKEPQKFQRLGGRIPKGALMLGPPGSGKTLLAKAVAGEAGVPFFSMSGSDFVEMFVGVGASRVRDLFEQGKRNAPCITGDAVVTLSGGRQMTIEEMFERRMVGVKVPTMSEDFRFEDATVIGITRKPAPDLFEITTSTSSVKATGNHLFPVLKGTGMEWVPAASLREGDYVAAPRVIATTDETPLIFDFLDDDVKLHLRGDRTGQRRTRLGEIRADLQRRHDEVEAISSGRGGFVSSTLHEVPAYLHEDILYVCGLLASDGTYGRPGDRTIIFTNTSPELHDRLSEILTTSFGYEPKKYRLTRAHAGMRDCWNSAIHHRLLCDLLRAVESRILELPAHMIAAWLRGVFDGDGCVRVSETTPQIIYSAWDERTNACIRDALLRIGLPTTVSPAAKVHRDGNIVITGRDLIARFVQRVGSDHAEKSVALDRLWSIIRDRATSSSRHDGIPAAAMIRSARVSLGMGQRAFRSGHTVSAHERALVTPSRSSLQAVVEEIDEYREARALETTSDLDQLRDLAHSAVLWSRVHRVESIKPEGPVYDLCLDRNHNFVVNRLFTHNCIIFIDEIDAVGRHRGAGLGGGHDEREQTLNQLLVEMDGFESNEGVIMIAATNRPDVLDPALLRPGRFDRQIVVDWPDVRGREGILKVHTRKIPLADDVDLRQIARATPGMAGADIANLVNEAALLAARRNQKKVTMREFEDAKDKVLLGTERKSLVMNEDERRSTAYHESGHALVAWLLPGSEPVDKVTIIPRGRALGVTSYLPHEDRHSRSKEDLIRTLCMMMGGRAAEYIVFNHLTTGASNDLERATALSRRMVCELGMSENLGPLTFGKKDEMVFLGREIATHKDYSEQTAVQIDQEVRSMVEGQYNKALELLRDNIDKLHLLAKTLLEREVIDGAQMNRVLRGETLEPIRPAETVSEVEEPKAQPLQPERKEDGPFDALGPTPSPSGA